MAIKIPRARIQISGGNILTIAEIEEQHPGSVWCSLLERANWLNKLDISNTAKRLTRLKGQTFINACDKIIRKW